MKFFLEGAGFSGSNTRAPQNKWIIMRQSNYSDTEMLKETTRSVTSQMPFA